jgi:two-component system, OmpR family, sensor kinase
MRSPFARVSLRARLVVVVTALLVVALVAVSLATLAALRLVLVGEIDDRLSSVIRNERQLARLVQDVGGGPGPQPTDYLVQFNDAEGTPADIRADPTVSRDAELPDLEGITLARLQRTGGAPFTVDGWRVTGRGVPVDVPPGQQTGSVLVALPLRGVEGTLIQLQGRLAVLGLVVVTACALLGWAAVHRAFRPLREVEAVTAAFADGDTSRRVREQPRGTEVGRLGAAVNEMLDRIETSLAAREASEARMRRFVGDASHELRTPLAAVRGFAELYRQGAVREPDDVARAFGRIEQESARMGGLVEDLLTLARLDEQRPLRREPVDLLVLAADAVHDAQALAPDREVRLTGPDGSAAPSPAVVSGDDARLRQVIGNLVGNAVRHTPSGTPLRIGVGSRGCWALWQVVDHGPGIPAEDAERVFERFFRADSSRARASGGGSGLGLAIVAALVRAHHGAVRVVPTPGGGATFEVALPLVGVAEDSQPAPRRG